MDDDYAAWESAERKASSASDSLLRRIARGEKVGLSELEEAAALRRAADLLRAARAKHPKKTSDWAKR